MFKPGERISIDGIFKEIIIFHHEGQTVVCPKITRAFHRGKPGFLESQTYGNRTKLPEPDNIVQNLDFDQKTLGESMCKTFTLTEDLLLSLMNLSTIEDKLKLVCSDNPLDNNISKYTFRAQISLSDPTIEIKVPPMQYTSEDRKEFGKQIQELLGANLIEPSESPHFSPAFLVNKHSEQKRGKRRMVINYKKLNDHTIGDGYLLPRKDELLDQIRRKKIFTSFDCKSGFWQVLLDNSSQKKAVKHLPPVHHPGPKEPLIIETDASDKYWGGILKAQPEEGPELICGYASGTFKPAEQNYHSNEKELLALINTIKRFQVYLIPVPFVARTDNKNVFFFLNTNIHGSYKQGRLVRWQLWLSYYDITFEHVEGINNIFADTLSREFAEICLSKT
jgi:hypothetical protein